MVRNFKGHKAINILILTQFFSDEAKTGLYSYVKYRMNRSNDFCLKALLETGNIFQFLSKLDLDLMKSLRNHYACPNFVRDIATAWQKAIPSDDFPPQNLDIFKMLKRIIISLLLQKRTSSDQERVFSHLATASHHGKYLSRTLSSCIIKTFNKNKRMFDDSTQEEPLKRE